MTSCALCVRSNTRMHQQQHQQLRCSVITVTLLEQQPCTVIAADFRLGRLCRRSSHAAVTSGPVLMCAGFVGYQEDPYSIPV
jgi:hypothetical protein